MKPISLAILMSLCINGYSQLFFGREVQDPDPNRRSSALVICPYTAEVYPEMTNTINVGRASLHHLNPYGAFDIYMEQSYEDLLKSQKGDNYDAIDKMFSKFEANIAINLYGRGAKNTSIFSKGSSYDYGTGTRRDFYTQGTGDAIVFGQLRLGYSSLKYTYETDLIDPEIQENNYDIPGMGLIETQSNFINIGFGRTKRYHNESLNSGIDRIGMKKLYFDFLFGPASTYSFYDETGNNAYVGTTPAQIIKSTGWRLGYEVVRLNHFSGYMKIELGVRPGVRPEIATAGDMYLYYGSLAVGLSFGSK